MPEAFALGFIAKDEWIAPERGFNVSWEMFAAPTEPQAVRPGLSP